MIYGGKNYFILLRIIFYGTVIFSSTQILAVDSTDNSQFQAFDNQISIGYGYSKSTMSNPNNSYIQQTFSDQELNLNVERLENNHIWFDVNGAFVFSNNHQSGVNLPFSNNVQNLGFPASLTGKIGYAIPVAAVSGLQLTPYLTSGMILNYNGVTVPNAGFNNSYYYLYGFGGRAEYVINNSFMVYFDQTIGYLSDQNNNAVNLSAWDYNSTLGLKYNVTPIFQIGIQGFYNQTNVNNADAGYDSLSYTSRNIYQSTFGGLLSLGYVYDGHGAPSSAGTSNNSFANFDNAYSLGYGYAQANNYSSGSSTKSGIASNINYLDLNIQHLFLNGIWLNIDGQLMNNISQSNVTSGKYNDYAPTYLTYPGNVTTSLGYAFPLINDILQVIPYLNMGLDMNINSSTITQNQNVSSALSHDMYYQYGGGAKVEYLINKQVQLYFNQLFAVLDDQSGLGLGVWRSTSTLGAEYNVYGPLQLGLGVYYDQLSPTSSATSNPSNQNYLNQSTFGGLFSIGLRY